MNSSHECGADGLQILWDDADRVMCRRRRSRDGNHDSVLIVRPVGAHPSPASLERLVHEFRLKDELDGAWAVRPLELLSEDGRTLLVLDDPGGEPLERLLGAPMDVGRVLLLAAGIAATLSKLHQHGLVHKDVKPAHIIVDCPDGQTRLTGFGIASRLPRERQAPESPETIAGTLAYMAPEQTGRMNRSIDSRSDLYAFGVVLYQMLTGTLPFTADDPIEWVHCHIARKPVPPGERLNTVPAALSRIVMKLLAKTAEERYQTAAGVEHDLLRCLDDWQRQHRIDDFALGEQDTPDRLLIPERLYGREREVDTLAATFERVVKTGAPELVLLSGYAGIGKSSVVHQLHKVLLPPRGLFASGKFDQYKREIPYSTLVLAFQDLVRPLLGKCDAELAVWRAALLEALEPNARLMTDLIPELKLIIGDPPAAPEFEPQQAQSRFQLVFRRFIGVFARSEHPLVLFLDDLQWLDMATLDLLEDLLIRSDPQHLLLIGAYRDNEVDANHPLMAKLEAARHRGARIREMTLGPLGPEHIEQWIVDALHCDGAAKPVAPLARLVYEKTAGNPLFVVQFLHALAEQGLLHFQHDKSCWCWDLDRIRAQGYTDNVVDLMIGKVTHLPAETRHALQQLACLGNVARITMLSMVLGTAEEQVQAALLPAVRQELVERLDSHLRFIHDRVQEAAYSLIPEASRAEVHLRIGRLLVAQTPPEKRDEAIFEIVGQLNRGAALITEQEERDEVAALDLMAGKRAKASTAYASALTYLNAGAGLLAEDSWERRRELTFALELNRAECEFLTGALASAEERLTLLSTRAATTVERAALACLRADLYTTIGQSSRAVAVGLEYLRHLGVEWSSNPTDDDVRREYERFWAQLGNRTIEDLAELPLMTDPAFLATMDVLTKIGPAAFTDANLHALAMCWAANRSVEHGNSDAACDIYVRVGFIAAERFGDYQAGYRLGKLGCELVERRGLKRFQDRTWLMFAYHLMPYAQHVRAARDVLDRGFEIANKIGDLMFVGWYRCLYLTENLFAAGDPLPDVQREADRGLALAHKAQWGHVVDVVASQLGLIRSLRGLTGEFGSFDDATYSEAEIERRFAHDPNLTFAACMYFVRKLQARFHAGDFTSAVDAASRAQRHAASRLMYQAADCQFYGALARAALFDLQPPGGAQEALDALAAHHKQLQAWAQSCPENFESRAALVGAEIARLDHRDEEAMRLYEQAIRSAHSNGFVHLEALANELAARFYAARGFERIARFCLQDAHDAYLRWGADGKVRQLENAFPYLRTEAPAPGPTSTMRTSVEHLDLASVIEVSQAISGDIVLHRLIETIMRTATEQAGAERGLLILSNGIEQRVEAQATTGADTVLVQVRAQPVSAAALPESVLYYVVRTRQRVILSDAAAEHPFAADPYIRRHRVRSILCLPLMNRAELIGALYFENNLTTRAFTPTRIAMLELVASQAAITLQNARLYRDLAERERKIRSLVDANIIGIVVWNADGDLLEANDAFLHMVGYEREDLVSGRLRWRDLTPREWMAASERALVDAGQTGRAHPYDKEYIRKDGSRVPVMIGLATFEPGGNEGVGFVLDLSEHKRAQEALRESEEQWKAVFENNPTMFFMLDAAGTILSVNHFGAEQLGYTADELIGSSVRDLFHEADRQAVDRNTAYCLEHLGEPMSWELRKVRKDGEVVWVRETARTMLIKKRPVVLVVCEDITEAKRAAEALHEIQIELAHANRVDTIGQLAVSIAHEVNQPIAATITSAQAALRWLDAQPPDVERARQGLRRIVDDGNRAAAVVGRIRELIRKAPPRKEPVDINKAILEVVELTRGEASKLGVNVRTQLVDRLPLIQGDRVQLQQVLLNLVVNAMEAISGVSDGVRELLISARITDADNVLVAVCDSGPGFDAHSAERVFAPFYSTKPNGLGLGLSICRSIIQAHGGELWASANEPRGAILQFTVPTPPTA